MTQLIPHTHPRGLESFHDRTDSKTVTDHLATSHGVSCDADNESPFGLHIQAHRELAGQVAANDYAVWQRENVAKGTDSAGRTPRDRELGRIIIGMHDDGWPQQTADRIAQARADVRKETRAGIAKLLREVAEGRREYLGSYEKNPTNPRLRQMRDALVSEISLLEAAAKIAEGDTEPLYGLLPSWRWTDQMTAALYPKPEEPRG